MLRAKFIAILAVATASLATAVGAAPCPACPPCTDRPGCNMITSETVLAPDNPLTVYVTLRSLDACTGALVGGCQASFNDPTGEFITREQKCRLLADAINNEPTCSCYDVAETCDVDRKLTVTDPCPNVALAMGISNDPNIFSQTGSGVPIPDYEAEIITPSCGDPTPGQPNSGDEIATDVTLGGEGGGAPIVEGEGSHVEIVCRIVNRATGQELCAFTVETDTMPGDTPAMIVERLRTMLESELQRCAVGGVAHIDVRGGGRTLRGMSSDRTFIVCMAGGTSDEGVTMANAAGPANALPAVQMFRNRGQCLSTMMHANCEGMHGAARAECNHQQHAACDSFFDVFFD